MTAHNVRQYLEKIYSVPVADVRVKMVHHDLPPVDIPQKERSGRSLDSTDYPPKPERYEKFAYVRLVSSECLSLYVIKCYSLKCDLNTMFSCT
ncbi:unnamed protein product [Heterobilharzia americana]|nr:unnamed protein product [Heterobilharzia americana]